MSDFTTAPEYFDSREVIARIDELIAEFTDATGDDPSDFQMSEDDWAHGLGADGAAELTALINLRDEADHLIDWEYGETFIREDQFTSHVGGWLTEVGYSRDNLPDWLAIDWEATVNNFRGDYTEFEFLGETYLARAA